jgi:hypothetical protein
MGPELLHDAEDAAECEYLVSVKWIKKVLPENAQFRKRAGLFVARQIVASLSRQHRTLRFLAQQFKVNFERILAAD